MTRPLLVLLSLLPHLVFLPPQTALAQPIAIVEDSLYRAGVFLVVDALVANKTTQRIEGVEATVEFYDFFGALVRAEYTVTRPETLGPGHIGALRVITPYSDAVRRLHYRFTWRQNGGLVQSFLRRDIWTIGSATRDPNRWP